MGIDTGFARSKSWDEFAAPGAPAFDIVISVCDSAANEACPVWPRHPTTAHWGVADPADAEGSDAEKRFTFAKAARQLSTRIASLLALPIASLDRLALKSHVDAIGQAKD